MGQMKEIATTKSEVCRLWDLTVYHNQKFKDYKGDEHSQHSAHVIDYHDYMAFTAECGWIDATGYYDEYVHETAQEAA